MERMLVATDFSARSDRAVRRASLLARQLAARVDLLHVVDDDQPPRLLESRRNAAHEHLAELSRQVQATDGVRCRPRIILGEAFDGILRASAEASSDLIVIGAHRRQILRDMFVGTTAERIIRSGHRPVLMVNAVPAGPYRRVLAPMDLSERSADAARVLIELELAESAGIDVVHLFDAMAAPMMGRAALPPERTHAYLAEEEARAAREVRDFLTHTGLRIDRSILRRLEGAASDQICDVAKEMGSDVIVMGTRGSGDLSKLLLGSVAEGVLRRSDCDVLAVPPSEHL